MTCKTQTLQYNRYNTMKVKWNFNKKIVVCVGVCVCLVVQLPSHVWLLVTPWIAACQASLSFTVSQNLLIDSIESMIPSNYLILCQPFLFLPSIFPRIRVFSNELALCIWWPKYWSFSPSNEYPWYVHYTFSLSIHMFMDSWVLSIFWLLWIMLLWTWVYHLQKF